MTFLFSNRIVPRTVYTVHELNFHYSQNALYCSPFRCSLFLEHPSSSPCSYFSIPRTGCDDPGRLFCSSQDSTWCPCSLDSLFPGLPTVFLVSMHTGSGSIFGDPSLHLYHFRDCLCCFVAFHFCIPRTILVVPASEFTVQRTLCSVFLLSLHCSTERFLLFAVPILRQSTPFMWCCLYSSWSIRSCSGYSTTLFPEQ